MRTDRVEKVLCRLTERGLSQMVICDPSSIYYLTGKYQEPGERFYALYLRQDGRHKLFINNLFTVEEDLGVEKIWFSDMEDAVKIFSRYTDKQSLLGVDKDFPARFLLPLMECGAASGYVQASDCVDAVRACKDAGERDAMRTASHLNDLGMAQFQALLHPGVTEREIAQELEKHYFALGADGNSFVPSVAFGANAALNHHVSDNTKLQDGDCALLDVGCLHGRYCADMTRTFFCGSVSERHRRIYEIVRRANEAAEAIIRPGVLFAEIDLAARNVIEQAGFGNYFFNRVGHSIGLDVHESGDVSSVHREPVQPGMIFSVEPGIYIVGEVGMRIEDLVLVTETGCEILNHFSHALQIVK